MPVRSSYVQGTPNWIDLSATDQDAAKDFYGELFGWTFDDQPMSDGVYSMALKDDGLVGAISVLPPDLAAQHSPAMWNTYLAVDDVDAALARVDAAGGKTVMAAFDVTDAGRMAFIIDPTGAPLALWQAGNHIGATLVNESGSFIWNDLRTDDVGGAAAFYEAVFGLTRRRAGVGRGAVHQFANRCRRCRRHLDSHRRRRTERVADLLRGR